MPWHEVHDFFLNNFSGTYCTNIAKLVGHIIDSGYSQRLNACTSVDRLLISIYDPIEYNRETLHVSFDRVSQRWSFNYYAKPFQQADFSRNYSSEHGIEKFDNFIKMIAW